MNNIRYTVWRWFDPTKEGSNEQWNVGLAAKAKRSTTNQFEVANEVLCTRLGVALNLPVPLGVPIEDDGKLWYASLHASASQDSLPPATAGDIQAILADQSLCCGILMFDSWILNEDRARWNLSFDRTLRRAVIFDHGRAFYDHRGRSYLDSKRNDICINQHCLKGIKSLWAFDEWHKRLMDIPEGYIRESVAVATSVGLPGTEGDFAVNFLLDRRLRLREIFKYQRRNVFTDLQEGLFDPFSGEFSDYRI
jgi:hypothetical protein